MLYFILEKIGEENFSKLMTVTDKQNRTPFMISTYSVNNSNDIFDLILYFTPIEVLNNLDTVHNVNAIGWYNLRLVDNEYIFTKLNEIFKNEHELI